KEWLPTRIIVRAWKESLAKYWVGDHDSVQLILYPGVAMRAESPDYMLIFRESTPEVYEEMTSQQRRAHLDRWNAWCDELAGQGRLQSGHPLGSEGTTISAARGKRPIDGPFAEAKELVGGYFIIVAADLDEATAIAEQCPLLS